MQSKESRYGVWFFSAPQTEFQFFFSSDIHLSEIERPNSDRSFAGTPVTPSRHTALHYTARATGPLHRHNIIIIHLIIIPQSLVSVPQSKNVVLFIVWSLVFTSTHTQTQFLSRVSYHCVSSSLSLHDMLVRSLLSSSPLLMLLLLLPFPVPDQKARTRTVIKSNWALVSNRTPDDDSSVW